MPLIEDWNTTSKDSSSSRHFKDSPLVLLVEDDISMLTLMSEELKHHGCRIMYATTTKEAQMALNTQLPDVIVLDLMLQEDLTGWQLVEQLKEHHETARIPVIISSALEPQKDYFETLQIADYLVKPYPPERLSQTVFMVLED